MYVGSLKTDICVTLFLKYLILWQDLGQDKPKQKKRDDLVLGYSFLSMNIWYRKPCWNKFELSIKSG